MLQAEAAGCLKNQRVAIGIYGSMPFWEEIFLNFFSEEVFSEEVFFEEVFFEEVFFGEMFFEEMFFEEAFFKG